jgi:DNA ligase-1
VSRPAVSDPSSFQAWAETAERVRATTKRLEKSAALEAYLPTLDDASLMIACRFFAGIVFPRHDMRTTQVGGSIVYGALVAISGIDEATLHERVIALGDLGDLARELFEAAPPSGQSVVEIASAFAGLASTGGSNAKRSLVRAMLEPLGGTEAQYAVKLMLGGGELRIGLKEAQVEEALARAYGQPLSLLRHANLLRGDIGEVALLARAGQLESARLALFHPIGFMLAQPLASAELIAVTLPAPFAVEDKYDGIRAQAHIGRDAAGQPRVALYSRTLDEITHGYPDVTAALAELGRAIERGGPPAKHGGLADGIAHHRSNVPPTVRTSAEQAGAGTGAEQGTVGVDVVGGAPAMEPAAADEACGVSGESLPDRGVVLDGELLAYDPADPTRARPFKALQRRLGRKTLTPTMLAEVPVQFVAYDILAAEGTLVIGEPYRERRARLEALEWPGAAARLTPVTYVDRAESVDAAFDAAREAGNEGIIAKALDSPYTPGRRGKQWIKLKRALATLDVVVTGVERGHGRRRAVLSDYTFAVRASETDPTLLNVGKAYNGLTDAEILELTSRFDALTIQRFGRFHQVRPEVVLEVTFDVVQRSARHKAGYALRFPRIVRVRDDKPVSEIDTLARVRELAGDQEATGDADPAAADA